MCQELCKLQSIFQSTLPARGSDKRIDYNAQRLANFNPRSPQGGATKVSDAKDFDAILISIHAPRKGERLRRHSIQAVQQDFNPRSPQGGATI